MEFSLISKFLYNYVLDPEFHTRILCCRWKIRGGFDIVPKGNGFLVFKFNCEEDKVMVKIGGPW